MAIYICTHLLDLKHICRRTYTTRLADAKFMIFFFTKKMISDFFFYLILKKDTKQTGVHHLFNNIEMLGIFGKTKWIVCFLRYFGRTHMCNANSLI